MMYRSSCLAYLTVARALRKSFNASNTMIEPMPQRLSNPSVNSATSSEYCIQRKILWPRVLKFNGVLRISLAIRRMRSKGSSFRNITEASMAAPPVRSMT